MENKEPKMVLTPLGMINALKKYKSEKGCDFLKSCLQSTSSKNYIALFLATNYDVMSPNLYEEYRKQEKTSGRTITDNFSLPRVVKRMKNDEGMQELFIWHTSNKIAHIAEYNIKMLILSEMESARRSLEYDYREQQQIDAIDLNSFVRAMTRGDSTDDINAEFNIPKKIIEVLRENLAIKGIDELVILRTDAYYLKSMYTKKVLDRLSQPDNEINYGIVRLPRQKPILVVDIPKRGQISTHIIEPDIIRSLSKHPKYDDRYYFEKNTVCFPPRITCEEAKRYFKEKKKLSREDLIEIAKELEINSGRKIVEEQSDSNFDFRKLLGKNGSFIHYLAIKSGYTKEDFDKLYFRGKYNPQKPKRNQQNNQINNGKKYNSQSKGWGHTD